MRTGEAFALTWDDVDLEKRSIKVNKTVYAKDKQENGRWYLGTTKTLGSNRKIYICDTLYRILLDYKTIQEDYRKQYGKNYKRYILEEVKSKYGKIIEYKVAESNLRRNKIQMVFTRKNGTYVGTDIVKYPFKIINHELGIKCRFYDLRGSFATSCLRNGGEIKDIAEVLGHKRIETTEKYYISSTNKDDEERREKMEDWKNTKDFPMQSQMLNQLYQHGMVISDMKEKMKSFFEEIKSVSKKKKKKIRIFKR